MMKKPPLPSLLAFAFLAATEVKAEPVVTNVTAAQRPGTKLVDITYDLASPLPVKVTLEISSNDGGVFSVPSHTLEGDAGFAVAPGTGKAITWDAGADWNSQYSTQMRFRVTADDFADSLSYIPAGPFIMGRTSGDTGSNAPPVTVNVGAFKIMTTEVSKAEWDSVRAWGLANEYPDLSSGSGKAGTHPIQSISWYAVVKWCNARSEMEGLTPCYYLDALHSTVYRTGSSTLDHAWVRWDADGYRLPTEAEWEKAARGGVIGKRFPWGTDMISHAEANFNNSGTRDYTYGTLGTHPLFTDEVVPPTAPCGFFAPNAYGLFDMSGNVMEWMWDWYDGAYYPTINGASNPTGPADSPSGLKVRRGGSANSDETVVRCFYRFYNVPTYFAVNTGFRVVTGSPARHPESSRETSDAVVVNTRIPQALTFEIEPDQLTTNSVPLSATGGGSDKPVTFAVTSGPGVIGVGNVLTFTTAGEVSVTASQEGNEIYSPAPDVTRTFVVTKAVAAVMLGDLYQGPDGTPKTVTVITEPPGLDVILTYNGGTEPPSALGSHTVTATVEDLIYQGSVTGALVLDHRADRHVARPAQEAELESLADIAWDVSAMGLYDGLLRDEADGRTLLGAIETLRVSAPRPGRVEGGAVSGRLRLPGFAMALRGRFDAGGVLNLDLNRKGIGAVEVRLKLQRTPAGNEAVTGTVNWAGTTAEAYLPQAVNAPTAQQGKYTLLLPSEPGWGADEPGGDGWAVASVSPTGVVKVKGRLGDGASLTETAYLSGEGEFCLYQELYRTKPVKGKLGGRVVLRDEPETSDFDGPLQWVKLPDNREKSYKSGFSVEVWALGSRFTAPPNGQRLLAELADAEPNACLNLIGPNLPAAADGELERVLIWLGNNTLRHYGPEILNGRGNRGTGQVSGNYRDPAGGLRFSFQGVVFQKQGLAAGQFFTSGGSGALRIVPGTDFPYPGSEDAGAAAWASAPEDEAAAPGLTARNLEPAAVGRYDGVLADAGGAFGGAIENLRITPSGASSGTLWLLGFRYAMRGSFDIINGSATYVISRPGLPPIAVTLQLHLADGAADGYQLTGTVSVAGMEYGVDAQRLPVYSKTLRAPQEGAYTLALLAPEDVNPVLEPGGDGYATLKVNHLARCTGALVLADGTKATFAGHVSRNGEWSLHRGLYGGNPARGYLAGKTAFRDVPGVSDLDGTWRWVKQSGATPKSPAYAGGFGVSRKVSGSKYTAPGKGARAWAGLDDAYHNTWLRLAGPILPALDRVATWAATNKVAYYGPDKLTVKVNSKTGLVTGNYRNAPPSVNQSFGGVLLQKQSLVTGSYATPGGSGRFWMQKRP